MLWLLGDVLCFLTGITLLVKGLRAYRPTDSPRCQACGYDLTGLGSSVCPECGTLLTAETVIHIERYRRPRVIILGASLLVLSVLLGIRVGLLWESWRQPPSGPAISATVLKAKAAIAGFRADLISGAWAAKNERSARSEDWKWGPMMSFHDNLSSIKRTISKRRLDAKMKSAAMIEIEAALYLYGTEFRAASGLDSTNPNAGQAIVPELDKIDKHLDNLLQLLNGS